MRRIDVLGVLLLFWGGVALTAVENPLIDFTPLSALDNAAQNQNAATFRDFKESAGLGYTEEELAEMNTSLYVENWRIKLNPSSNFVANDRLSFVRVAPVEQTARKYAGLDVMGIRVSYPEGAFNSHATLAPPFRIPSFEVAGQTIDQGTTFIQNGLLENVGVLKAVKVNVLGRNYPIRMVLVLRDNDYVEHRIDMGLIDFRGWTEVEWRNPNYITDVKKRDLKKNPLYPFFSISDQTMSFDRIVFVRDALYPEITDFVTYIKDVRLVYDLAMIESVVDVNDEALWGILYEKQLQQQKEETRLLGEREILEVLERPLVDTSQDGGQQQGGAAAPAAAAPADAAAAAPAP